VARHEPFEQPLPPEDDHHAADVHGKIEDLTWTFDIVELARKHEQPVTDAIPTPFAAWSQACRMDGGGVGLAPSWHITMAGASGSGKSALALNLACCAIRAGIPALYLSYEMSRPQLVTRFLGIFSGCDIMHLERGKQFQRSTFMEAAECWRNGAKANLFIVERPARTVAGMLALLTDAVETFGCKLLIVDYVQLVGLTDHDDIFGRTQRVSATLQETAQRMNVTTVGLSQFNRSQSFNRKEEPVNEGLAGGSALENDSDQVVLLDHSKYERLDPVTAKARLLLSKNRHGPTVRIPVKWDYRNLRVSDWTSYDDAKQKIASRSTTTAGREK
jgi:replicative DNA helicase